MSPRADARVWWSAVARRDDIPRAIAAPLGGRARIEVTREEARQALAWAGTVEGWAGTAAKPLVVYPTNALASPATGEVA